MEIYFSEKSIPEDQAADFLINSDESNADILSESHIPLTREKSFIERQVERFGSEVLHFLLGGLLSSYFILFYKSASLANSVILIFILCILLVANEFPKFQALGRFLRLSLFCICTICYFSCLLPTLWNHLGWSTFLASTFLSLSCMAYFTYILHRSIPTFWSLHKLRVLVPVLSIHLLFVLAYVFKVIPPVPLSVQQIGIYHHVEKKEGKYYLTHYKSPWRFWERGDQQFYAEEGEAIYCFIRVFSPANFGDKLMLRWLHKNKSGEWVTWDKIPIAVRGGRKKGFRGYAYKRNYQEGQWQIRVESSDEREISRIYLNVMPEEDRANRVVKLDVQ